MTAEAATEGITAAIVPAEAVAMIAAHGMAVGATVVRDKPVAMLTVTAAEIVAIAPVRVIRLTPQFAPG